MKCPYCGQSWVPPDSNIGSRIKAHSLSVAEYKLAHAEQEAMIRLLYKDQQVYTHIDLYSPLDFGENYLYRVKL